MTTEQLVAALRACGKTVASAESCTGGLIGARLTAVPGSSAVFRGGIISYTDAVKRDVLGVPQQLLDIFGAVSSEVAARMAQGARDRCGSDFAVSVTGLAGPDGDGSGKPVGLVYLGIADENGTAVHEYHFTGSRAEIREAAAEAAEALLAERLAQQ